MPFSSRLLAATATLPLIGAMAISSPARADPTPECNIPLGFTDERSLECGVDADAASIGFNNVAVGYKAQVQRTSTFDVAMDNIVVGANASTTADYATALGASARATADNAVALGQASVADQAFTVSVGRNDFQRRIVNVAEGIDDNDAVTVRQLNNALGNTPNVLAEAKAYTDTRETLIRNDMAAGDAATLASANGYTDQREAAIRSDIVQGDAATLASAQAYADSGDAATLMSARSYSDAGDERVAGLAGAAQTRADQAVALNEGLGASTAAALGGGARYDAGTGRVSAPSYAVGGQSYNNVGAALGAIDNRLNALGGQIDGMLNLSYSIRKEARRGIAAAVALTNAPFPSASGRTSYAANTAVYRGEIAFSASFAHRLNIDTPFAITAGVSHSGGKDTAARVGIAGEF